MIKNLLLVSFFLLLVSDFSFAQQIIPNDTLITLERDPGFFGKIGEAPCPFYKLTIFADGKVEIEPKEYKDNAAKIVSGEIIKSRINNEQLKELTAEFERIDFYSLKSTSENEH